MPASSLNTNIKQDEVNTTQLFLFLLSFKSKITVTIIPKVKNSQDAKLRMNGVFVQGLTSDVNV